ncbi:hypothetical protein [Brachybacterium paraconglomeratum]|uniref:hypothetical protein n=1 Tax=Brachybacterium paraconglomeratum TaxID=173362 RepID=UPI003FD147FB
MPTAARPSRPADAEDPSPRSRPVAALLLGAEALLLVVTASYFLLAAADGGITARLGIGLGVFLLLFAVGVGLAARSVLARGRFGTGFGITWQLFQALVGASMISSGMVWQGALALVLAIVVFVRLARLVRSTPLPSRMD